MRVRPGPLLIVEVVNATWTKSTRVGEPARRLRAVPEAVELPKDVDLYRATGLVYSEHFGERNGFDGPYRTLVTVLHDRESFSISNISVDWEGDRAVRLTYQWHPRSSGEPKREYMDRSGNFVPVRHTLTLAVGEWGRVRCNGRHRTWDDLWYSKCVYNVGLFSAFNPRVFLDTEPNHTYSQMAMLHGHARAAARWQEPAKRPTSQPPGLGASAGTSHQPLRRR